MNTIQNKTILGRNISALLNPRPVVLVTCCDKNGVPNVLSAAWHTPLSHDPPLLGISIDKRRYSHHLIVASGEFAINVVGPEFQPAIEFCGNCSGAEVDKITSAKLNLKQAYHIRPPLIDGALAHLECVVRQQVNAGNHSFFIADVLYAEAREDGFSDCWEASIGSVLLCLQRDRFVTWSLNK
jgi:flavin reductase (DIM6/NTAB) family NADH-FMN oxidoreductase RutF